MQAGLLRYCCEQHHTAYLPIRTVLQQFLPTFRRSLLTLLAVLIASGLWAQSVATDGRSAQAVSDSIDHALKARFDALDSLGTPIDTLPLVRKTQQLPSLKTVAKALPAPKKTFVPSPQRALWLSLVLPGAGQIYNRKYWKLPIVYGGFLGCTYAFLWNQQMYMDYSQAYLDIMDSDPTTNSYKQMFPPTYDIDSRLDQFKTVFKNRKDRYRRYRDLSAFAFVGVYLLSVVDAYVDAQLSVFDITPDLTLSISPTMIESFNGHQRTRTQAIGATFTF